MAKVTKNDIVKQYFSLLSKIMKVQKDINGREGSAPDEYNDSITKIFAILILLGCEYQEKGINIVLEYDGEEYRIEKEPVKRFVDFNNVITKHESKNTKNIEQNTEFKSILNEKSFVEDNKTIPTIKEDEKTISEQKDLISKDDIEENKHDNVYSIENTENIENTEKELIIEENKASEICKNEILIDEKLSIDNNKENADVAKKEYDIVNEEEPTDKVDILNKQDETNNSDKSKEIDVKDKNKQDELELNISEEINKEKKLEEKAEKHSDDENIYPLDDPFENKTNLMDKILEADSSVIFVPETTKITTTWLDKISENLIEDAEDYKPFENFIYNQHTIKLKTNEGFEKTVKFTVYPLEYKDNKIPTSILVISDYYGRYKYSYSEKRKIIEITIDDIDFLISGKWFDGEFESMISPTSGVKEDSIVSDVIKVHSKNVYPRYFGQRINIEDIAIDVFPVSNQNNRYGIVPSVALVKSGHELKSFITGEDGRLMIPTHGKLYAYDTYWMGNGFHTTES